MTHQQNWEFKLCDSKLLRTKHNNANDSIDCHVRIEFNLHKFHVLIFVKLVGSTEIPNIFRTDFTCTTFTCHQLQVQKLIIGTDRRYIKSINVSKLQ